MILCMNSVLVFLKSFCRESVLFLCEESLLKSCKHIENF